MNIKIIASNKNWIESDAVAQLKKVLQLPGMEIAVGMPDLHPGKGAPVGAAFASRGVFYPHLVGNDIGCGMGFWQTDLPIVDLRIDKWIKKLRSLETGSKGLGTIGGGNHFAEVQRVCQIFDSVLFESLGLRKSALYVLVHTGSRGLGEKILRDHVDRFGAGPLVEDSPDAHSYLVSHDEAVGWAMRNRSQIANRLSVLIGGHITKVLDLCHNKIQSVNIQGTNYYLHRKGAAPSDCGPFVIPGSRGSLSYLGIAVNSQEENLFSIAHGAGRKWQRSECKARLRNRFRKSQLLKNKFGGMVICDDKDLLYEEAPEAYKDVDVVVADLVEAGIIKIVASFLPLITYKSAEVR